MGLFKGPQSAIDFGVTLLKFEMSLTDSLSHISVLILETLLLMSHSLDAVKNVSGVDIMQISTVEVEQVCKS